MSTTVQETEKQFQDIMAECRQLFAKKLHDYGASWRMLRPSSLTDQLFIKAKRIRTLEITKESLVGEGIRPEFIALINYGIIGLIQLKEGFADTIDTTPDEALKLYDHYAHEAFELMKRKNHGHQLYRFHPHKDRACQRARRKRGKGSRLGRHRQQLLRHH